MFPLAASEAHVSFESLSFTLFHLLLIFIFSTHETSKNYIPFTFACPPSTGVSHYLLAGLSWQKKPRMISASKTQIVHRSMTYVTLTAMPIPVSLMSEGFKKGVC